MQNSTNLTCFITFFIHNTFLKTNQAKLKMSNFPLQLKSFFRSPTILFTVFATAISTYQDSFKIPKRIVISKFISSLHNLFPFQKENNGILLQPISSNNFRRMAFKGKHRPFREMAETFL